ncbi:MAG: tetratricopeptide repeat protein, partial [Pseudomonadota bacterium]
KAVGKLNPKDGFVELQFRKVGYKTKSLWVPVTSAGGLRSNLKITLEEDKEGVANFESVSEILDQMFLAQKFARLKQYERALIEIDRIIKKYPDFARALTLKGSIYFANGDFKNSLLAYEKALQANPKFDHALEMVTKVRKQLKLPPRAPASVRGGGK